jgi:hypothetical protein
MLVISPVAIDVVPHRENADVVLEERIERLEGIHAERLLERDLGVRRGEEDVAGQIVDFLALDGPQNPFFPGHGLDPGVR